MRVLQRNRPFIHLINIYIRALLLSELFPNSFPNVNAVCLCDPSVSLQGREGKTEIPVG